MKYKVFISYRRSNGGLERAKDLSWRDQAKLPESMRELGYYNGVEYNHAYLDSTVQKLAGYLGKRRHFFHHQMFGRKSLEARAVQYSIAQHDYYTGDFATALKTCEEILDTTDVAEDTTAVSAVKHLQAKTQGGFEQVWRSSSNC